MGARADDGITEIVNFTSDCVWYAPHVCDFPLSYVTVQQWDGERFVTVGYRHPTSTLPATVQKLNERAIALAEAEQWKDARELIDQAAALMPQSPDISWNASLIHFIADDRADTHVDQKQEEPFAYLTYTLAFGDYNTIMEQMRVLTPAMIFTDTSPLLGHMTSMKYPRQYYDMRHDQGVAEWYVKITTETIAMFPDRAATYFVRGWASYMANWRDPRALSDIAQAAQLAPQEPLFAQSLQYLRDKTPAP